MEKEAQFHDDLYLAIIKSYLDTESVTKTAETLHTNPVRVRRVLITEGLWSSKTSLEIEHYRNLGKTTAEIAEILSTTEKAVQQYLPYTRGFYLGENRSVDALNSADYRNRIRVAKERTIRNKLNTAVEKGWEEMYEKEEMKTSCERIGIKNIPASEEPPELTDFHMEQYPGVLTDRELEDFDYSKAKCQGEDVYRLHLELVGKADPNDKEEAVRVLRAYGNVKNGDSISRDIIVPGCMPLYALHYVIQKLFGWQNYHLHHFQLSEEAFLKITDDNAGKWSELVGVLFQSPEMTDEDRYWADDYETGSFKTWLKKKYTGPYMSLNHGEGFQQSKLDVEKMKSWVPFIELEYAMGYHQKEYLYMAKACKGQKVSEITERDKERGIIRKEIVPFEKAPMRAISLLFETAPYQILERLSIQQVMAFHDRRLKDGLADYEEIKETFDEFMEEDLKYDLEELKNEGIDAPWRQPYISSVTDTLYYEYDYGDGWRVKITGSIGCADLVENGIVSQDEIDEALRTVYLKYRPVCLAADGFPVVEDVGGFGGYIRFLRGINKDRTKDNWDYDSSDTLGWAKSLGWSKRKIQPKNML